MSTLADDTFPSNLTWDEFLALPHELRNAQLIDGEVIVDAPNELHENVVQNLIILFHDWRRSGNDRGQTSTQQPIKINDRRGYQPDFAWWPEDRCPPSDEPHRRLRDQLPGLVVEVLSPSTRNFDLLRKRHDYERIGIDEVWFIDPDPSQHFLLAYQRKVAGEPFLDIEAGPGDRLTSPLLEGFELEVDRLFER